MRHYVLGQVHASGVSLLLLIDVRGIMLIAE